MQKRRRRGRGGDGGGSITGAHIYSRLVFTNLAKKGMEKLVEDVRIRSRVEFQLAKNVVFWSWEYFTMDG